MMNREVILENLFENAYLLLLIDQYDDGLWGKSITVEVKKLNTSPEEVQISEKRKRAESITVTLFAVDAIYTFTKNFKNPAIESVLKCLPKHKDNGGYGSFGGLISIYPIPIYQVKTSCRHTATACLIYLLIEDHIDEKIAKSVLFLVDHAQKDGGWGVSADPTKDDSDCLSSAYVLQLLTIVKEKSIKGTLLEDYSSELDGAITNGLKWLKKNNEQNDGFWVFYDKITMKVAHSAEVLCSFYKLKNYETELYEETLDRMASLQNKDGGFPSSISIKGNISDLVTTIWIVNALVNSDCDKYGDQIENGINFIVANSNKSYMKNLTAETWAMLLKLSDYRNIHISSELDDEIQNLANAINDKVFKNRDTHFLLKKLPKKFHIAKEATVRILEKYNSDIINRNPIEEWISRMPGWIKWVITTIIITIIVGLITNLIYDLLLH